MKKQTPNTNDILLAARGQAHSLFQAAAGSSKDNGAANALLQLALYATSLVDDLHRSLNPEGIREASKYYEEFPILASGVRRANGFQLKNVYALPLGEYRPFKCDASVGPAAKWNNIRDVIIRLAYPKFERIRNGVAESDVSSALAGRIRRLGPISQGTAWDWAELMTEYFHQGSGWDEFVPLVASPVKVKKRNFSKRRGNVVAKFGGDDLREAKGPDGKTHFYPKPGMPNQATAELDFIDAQKLADKSKRLKASETQPPSDDERLGAVKDAFYDCLKSILKR